MKRIILYVAILIVGIAIGFLTNRLVYEHDTKPYVEKIDSLENQLKMVRLAQYADSVSGNKVLFKTLLSDVIYIDSISTQMGMDYKLVMSIITKESGWINENLMQVMPVCIKSLGYKDWKMSRRFSILVGIKSLKYLMEEKKFDFARTIVAYNLGEGGQSTVKYPEKFPYYKRVMKEYKRIGEIE